MSNKHFLNNIFKEKKFTAKELEEIIPKFKQVNYSKNDFLIVEGKTSNYYWFIESGFVRSYAIDINDNDVSTNFYTTGDVVIDWPSFFLRQPSKEYIQALSDCICWQLDFDTFQVLFHSIESFREQGRANLVASYFILKQQSISMISDSAKDRYLRLLEEKPHIIQNVSLKHIATFLGITDSSLSRIRKELSNE